MSLADLEVKLAKSPKKRSYYKWHTQKRHSWLLSCVPTLFDPMDCILPGFSVHGIFQAGILEWVAISFSMRSSQPRDWTQVSWQIDGETMETVTYFLSLGSKITADGDCSHEIKRCLLLGRKAMTNLDSILKSRDIILPTNVHLVKAIVFPVVMYRCESWTIKKTKHCFWTVVLEKSLESPLDWKEINQSILNIHWKDWCWSWSSNRLWPPDAKILLIRKDPDAGKDRR